MYKWYLLHTRPRWEKKVSDALAQKGIVSYCPVKKVRRQWSDRIKVVEAPLFVSCVFVKIIPEQRTLVRLTEGVVNFAYRDGKPVQVKEGQLHALKKILQTDGIYGLKENFSNTTKNRAVYSKSIKNFLHGFSTWITAFNNQPKIVQPRTNL